MGVEQRIYRKPNPNYLSGKEPEPDTPGAPPRTQVEINGKAVSVPIKTGIAISAIKVNPSITGEELANLIHVDPSPFDIAASKRLLNTSKKLLRGEKPVANRGNPTRNASASPDLGKSPTKQVGTYINYGPKYIHKGSNNPEEEIQNILRTPFTAEELIAVAYGDILTAKKIAALLGMDENEALLHVKAVSEKLKKLSFEDLTPDEQKTRTLLES